MEYDKLAQMEFKIDQLNTQLQHQKGMIWIIGEIIKNATSISSFRELMKLITDMLMGVLGVSSCYLWVRNNNHPYTLHFRSIFLQNTYQEVQVDQIPDFLAEIKKSKLFQGADIHMPLIEATPLPCSRLAVPLNDFQHHVPMGFLVVEHHTEDFFNETTTLLFNTLAIIIGSNSGKSKLFEVAAKEAEHDPLTNIYNRKFLSQFLEDFKPASTPLSLCIFDIDCFKEVNDLHGHSMGDSVLKDLAQATNHIVTPYNGKTIRYGGDEFVILLNLPLKEAIPVLEQIQTLTHTLPISKQLRSGVTITMGVAEYPYHTSNIDDLLHIADTALLQGKALGKDVLKVGKKRDH